MYDAKYQKLANVKKSNAIIGLQNTITQVELNVLLTMYIYIFFKEPLPLLVRLTPLACRVGQYASEFL